MLTARKIPAERQDALLEALEAGRESGEIGPAERVLLAYSIKLTRAPGEMSAADAEALRRAGFDDRGIHDTCAIVAYFAFVNRIADGLGVELESKC